MLHICPDLHTTFYTNFIILVCYELIYTKKEDAVEKFQRMQREAMSNDPDSVAYNAARIRNDKRVSF